MATTALKNRRPGRWLVLVLAICIGLPALMTTQGCRALCRKLYPCQECPPTEHLVAVYVKENGTTCAAPQMTIAKRGEWVLIINATQAKVTLKAPVSYPVFEGPESNEVTLEPGTSKKLKVSGDAQLHQPVKFTIEPRPTCPEYPGPGIDIDG
jgi:hypothetical protein